MLSVDDGDLNSWEDYEYFQRRNKTISFFCPIDIGDRGYKQENNKANMT